eukprot:CAMPEP_0196176464 /NCGR_PEP_ID=MMETSP0911-20130528/8725_1 /TAXON_ID=49265 /ORGANISM="Thalassiosira rotula, Strain GSO102" /LENGTH=92 /DNA_ID=CAMNT_0041444207 /DNA_START=124 /DNA_END=402 /DNA_ORIENTATION=+
MNKFAKAVATPATKSKLTPPPRELLLDASSSAPSPRIPSPSPFEIPATSPFCTRLLALAALRYSFASTSYAFPDWNHVPAELCNASSADTGM